MRINAGSEALEACIREHAAKLQRFHSRITSCRVVVEEPARHHRTGREFEVHVEVRVPGHAEIVATRNADADAYVALKEAFDAVTRQLETAAQTMREEARRGAPGAP
jgi:ribosomal subunit interface protein